MIAPDDAESPDRPHVDRPSPFDDPAFVAGLRPIPSGSIAAAERRPAADIVGEDLGARPVQVEIGAFDGLVLLCFLHVRCDGCEGFWRGLGAAPSTEYPDTVSAVVVTKGADSVERAEVARVAGAVGSPDGVPVVMSDAAWADYRVTGYPFFVLVDAAQGVIVGETVAFGWSDVRALIEASGH
jgi:hypothetical protein